MTSERALPSHYPASPRNDNQDLSSRMCMPRGASPGLESDDPDGNPAGTSDAIRPSRRTVPEKLSAGATVDGMEPALLIFNEVLPVFIHCLLAARRKVDIRAPGRVFAPRLNLRRALLPRGGRAEPHALRIVPRPPCIERYLNREYAFRPG